MILGDSSDDFWTQSAASLNAPNLFYINEQVIEDVEPLDDQFGRFPVQNIPDVLQKVLLEPVEQLCFAVVDGSQIPDLDIRLSASELQHCSLLKGEAAEEYGSTGPWLIQIASPDALMRSLFTRSKKNAPKQGYWGRDAAIFIRTRLTLAELRAHLRRFLRVRDPAGKWMLFRFYDPRIMATYLRGIADWEERSRHWFEAHDGGRIDAIITCCSDQSTSLFTLNESALTIPPPPRPAFILTDRDRYPLRQYTRDKTIRKIARDLKRLQALKLEHWSEAEVYSSVRKTAAKLAPLGITHAGDLMRFAALDLHYGHGFEQRDPEGRLASILSSQHNGRINFKRFTKRLLQVESII